MWYNNNNNYDPVSVEMTPPPTYYNEVRGTLSLLDELPPTYEEHISNYSRGDFEAGTINFGEELDEYNGEYFDGIFCCGMSFGFLCLMIFCCISLIIVSMFGIVWWLTYLN